MKIYSPPKFIVERDESRCINCEVCCNQCSFGNHYYCPEDDCVKSYQDRCIGCQRCVVFCPTGALTVRRYQSEYRENDEIPAKLMFHQYPPFHVCKIGSGEFQRWLMHYENPISLQHPADPSVEGSAGIMCS